MLTPLREYLSSLAARGTVDSEGQFTLNAARATEVMTHAMPSPVHYLLKVVQVANRAGAASLHISLGRQQTRLQFQAAPDRLAELQSALSRALSETTGEGDSLADDLSLAALGAVGAGSALVRGADSLLNWDALSNRHGYEPIVSRQVEVGAPQFGGRSFGLGTTSWLGQAQPLRPCSRALAECRCCRPARW